MRTAFAGGSGLVHFIALYAAAAAGGSAAEPSIFTCPWTEFPRDVAPPGRVQAALHTQARVRALWIATCDCPPAALKTYDAPERFQPKLPTPLLHLLRACTRGWDACIAHPRLQS